MRITIVLLFVLFASTAFAADLPAWEFEDPDLVDWMGNGQVRDLHVSDGCLRAEVGDDDPIVVSPPVPPFPTSIGQRVEIRMSSDRAGVAQLFWAPNTEGPYGGFQPDRETVFQVKGDGEFHVYTIYPFWHGDPQIIGLRLDPPDDAHITIDFVRVTEIPTPETDATAWDFADDVAGWRALQDIEINHVAGRLAGRVTGPAPILMSPRFAAESPGLSWATIRMRVDAGRAGELQVLSAGAPGMARRSFQVIADGRFHTYNVLAAGPQPGGAGVIGLGLAPSLATDARFEIESITLASEPEGRTDLELVDFNPERAVTRADRESTIICILRNRGGEPARGLRATLSAPEWLTIVSAPSVEAAPDAPLRVTRQARFRWSLRPTRPGDAEFTVTVEGDNIEPQTYHTTVAYPAPQPAKPATADGKPYVPEPRPAQDDWQVGVYYFPGWDTGGRWDPINRARFPIPYLGFYREGDPEVADWHIKWAAEHGIDFFIYDWYWIQGSMHLTHALHDGYMNARYKDHLKFCLLWANHNPPGTSSEEDLLNVTRYWLDNYFKLPQYQTVEGKPLVVLFSPGRLTEDMGSAAVAAAFEKMRALCRAEGLPGLYLAACAVPAQAARLAREGYDAATGYNYPAAGSEGKRWAPYATMVTGYEEIWKEFLDRDEIKCIVPLAPGWDSRPWHGDHALVRYDNTPELFEDMCRRAKALLEEREQPPKLRMAIIEAWNEFGEGSYIEPTRPYGFGYLDAIRRVFTEAPEQHADVVPEDIGLGPYDVKMPPEALDKRAWEFETPGDAEGWDSVMQMTDVRAEDGSLKATTIGGDPAFFGPAVEIDAAQYRRVLVRMRVDGPEAPGSAQLFWRSTLLAESEATSCRFEIIADGEFHEYVLDVGNVPTWAGDIQRLRLDPGWTAGMQVEVDYIRVVE
ncbi:MAG: glycoside hydrolase family 99-like domain-containing protein [Armatimonadota bacterium]|nr:MAG: glycoside hydrolase family 99-like domain-containing protein [Armatimonadota bacterium]